ncbi:hypothetical protein Cgig2_005283 [Carnegiea gigantea]|uniref:Uncharacterized protein n=1 Tax=Carnegiea gigantea TaxID=171969 RepID=A0A9Q1GXQ5_9CARY|nr:hypothetical protein Cgig2_005283 [Carnegiea gigantea]
MCGLSTDDETLLRDVRKRCKSFQDSHEWLSNLTEGGVSDIVAIDVKGLTRAKLAAIGYMLPSALPKHMSESMSQDMCIGEPLWTTSADVVVIAQVFDGVRYVNTYCIWQGLPLLGYMCVVQLFFQCTWLDDVVLHGRLHVRVWYTLPALCPTPEAW